MTAPATYGERAFSRVQYGKETPATHGTAVAATRILAGEVLALAPDRKPTYPEDAIGVRARSYRSIIYNILNKGSLKVPHGYFQVLPLFLSCGIKGNVTATETTGGQADYAWAFTPSLTGDNAPDSFTLEYGDNVQAVETEYGMFDRIKLSGTIAQDQGDCPVVIEGGFFARQISDCAFTGALALPTCEPMNAKLTKLFCDTAWASVGATELANSLRKFDVEILTGLHPKSLGGATKTFNIHGQNIFDVRVTLDLEGTDLADALRDAALLQTFQVIRLTTTGSQIGTGTNHSLTIDVGGRWESVIPLASQDKGNNIATAVFNGQYDGTGAKLLQVALTTSINVI